MSLQDQRRPARGAGGPARDFQSHFRPLLLYFLRLGSVGFGGPIVLAGYMQRDLVDEHRWISREDYLEGLAFSQLSPGPLFAQLAMYLGWVAGGRVGATLAGITFVLPSFLMVLALAALYVHFGRLSWIQGAFYGIGAAVIAIIARSAYKLVRTTLGKDQLLWVLFCAMAITTAWTESEIVWLFLLCGAITAVAKSWPASGTGMRMTVPTIGPLMTGAHGVATTGTLWTLFGFFAKAGAFVFGSGLAIVPFLYGGVVRDFHRLSGSGSGGKLCRCASCFCAPVLHRHSRSALLSPICSKPTCECICEGCDCGRCGSNRWRCCRSRTAGYRRLADRLDRPDYICWPARYQENPGTSFDYRRRSAGTGHPERNTLTRSMNLR